MKRTYLLAAVSALTLASPAWAQQTDHSGAAPDPHTGHATETRANTPAPADSCTPEHAAMGHCTPPPMTTAQPAGDPHAGHETPAGKPPDPHAGHSAEPTAAPADPHAGHAAPAEPPEAQPDPHAGHEMTAKPAQADSHAGHGQASPQRPDPHPGHSIPEPQAPAPPAAPADRHSAV